MGGFASRAILMPPLPIMPFSDPATRSDPAPTAPHTLLIWLSPLPFLFLPADGPGFEVLRREGARGQIQPAGGIGAGTPVSLEAWL